MISHILRIDISRLKLAGDQGVLVNNPLSFI